MIDVDRVGRRLVRLCCCCRCLVLTTSCQSSTHDSMAAVCGFYAWSRQSSTRRLARGWVSPSGPTSLSSSSRSRDSSFRCSTASSTTRFTPSPTVTGVIS